MELNEVFIKYFKKDYVDKLSLLKETFGDVRADQRKITTLLAMVLFELYAINEKIQSHE